VRDLLENVQIMLLKDFDCGKVPAMVDFPTPPLADDTAITFRTSRILRFSGNPLCIRGSCGGAPLRGSPYILVN
jgi:hypothetical protein